MLKWEPLGGAVGCPIDARDEAARRGFFGLHKPELPSPVGQLVAAGEKKGKGAALVTFLDKLSRGLGLGLGGGVPSCSYLRVNGVSAGVFRFFFCCQWSRDGT